MKNRKQWIIVVLALVMAFTMCFGVLIACEEKHEHTYASEWSKDSTGHWHAATCEHTDEIKDKGSHSFKPIEGANAETCEICGYSQATTPNPGPDTPNPGPDTPTPVDPSYTKDMNIPENTGSFTNYTLPRGDNEKQLILYWREAEHDYNDNDIWLWYDDAVGCGYEMHPCSYGAKVIINVPSTVQKVGFIVRNNTTKHSMVWDADPNVGKVYDSDREALLTGDVTEIYLTGANQYQFASTDGGKNLTMIKVVTQMSISTFKQIEYSVVPAVKLDNMSQIVVKCDGQPVEITSVSSLNKTSASGTITLKESVNLSKNYEVTIEGYDAKMALPMGLFDSKEFGDMYNYDGELGAIIDSGSVAFKLWAPTASKVVLNIYPDGNGADDPQKIDMVLGEKGVWSHTVENKDDVINKYYTYTVSTAAGDKEAVDPYAKSAGVNGMRGMIIDLNDTNPENFADSTVMELKSYTDAIVWETHVRDFSNTIETSQYKGKYLAFTETGLTNAAGIPVGVDYIKNLGVTHIHLLPVFDYKSVDESSSEPQFNWGYDPQNYNVPEGSYSTDPYDGRVRVREYKQMVQALHNQGMGVVMDMVYNHTFDKDSNLNKIVPNYYYRYNADGSNSNGSGCGNDTASERYMFSKFMVDSVSYWVKEYKLDGLRFDLMGLHDIPTMQAIEKAVHAINPNAILYGEGWTMTTAAKQGTVMATQVNISKVTASENAAGSIAVFNDVMRDGLRGSVFNSDEKGYLANASVDNKTKVEFGLIGGESNKYSGSNWMVKDAAVINYISAHDNHTLWDRLQTPFIDAKGELTIEKDQLLAMNRLGAAIVMLSKGTPFMTAGEEMLRSKVNEDGSFNHNSYNSSDEVNNLKWDALTEGSDELAMMNYYKGLIEMRKSFAFLRDKSVVVKVNTVRNYLIVTYTHNDKVVGVAIINGTDKECSYNKLPADTTWSLVCNGTQAGTTELAKATSTDTVTVPARTAYVYVSSDLLA